MTAINIKAFRGKVPRTSPRLLQGNYAVEALNCKITAGRLDPIKGPALTHTSLAAAVGSMFRYRNQDLDYWLVWGGEVNVAKSPTAQDSRNRVFWTGDGEPRMAAFADAIVGSGPYPAGWYVLGVYVPTVAPTVGITGGSGTLESRAYVYTFRTQYGEESAPSPATVFSAFANATSWNLSAMEAPPPNSGTVSGASYLGAGITRVTMNTTRALLAHEQVTFASVGGMTELNGTFAIDSVPDATHVDVRLTATNAYTSGGTWARRAPHNLTGMKRCIYRTGGTNTDYKLVAEIDAATTSYTDSVTATALGATITTLQSAPPPKNGHSLVELANGAHAMLAGNQLCISEQYKPYSYPLTNRYAFSGQGVALVAAGNSAIVLRLDAKPRAYACTVPEAATGADLPTFAPCTNKAGVVDAGGYGLYPSHDGLYAVTPTDARNVTEKLFGLEEWRNVKPETFKAAFFDQCYFAMHDSDEDPDGRVLMIDMAEPDSVRELDEAVDAMYASPLDGRLYLAKGNKVYEHNANDTSRYLSYWRSGDFQMGPPLVFNCAQVHAEYGQIVPPDTSAQEDNAALLLAGPDALVGAFGDECGLVPWAGSNLLEVQSASANRVQFSLVKNGQIVFTKELNSSRPFRLPPGARAELFAVQIASSIPVYGVTVAQSMQELGRVSG